MVPVSRRIRAELRRLKIDFDIAFAQVSKDLDAGDPQYQAARNAYGLWRLAIDRFGLPLLDMLDAAEEDGFLSASEGVDRKSPIAPLTEEQQIELRAAFQDIDRMDAMMRLIDDDRL